MFDPLTNMGSIYLLFKGNPRNLYYIGILDGSLDLRLFSSKEPEIIEITLIYKGREGYKKTLRSQTPQFPFSPNPQEREFTFVPNLFPGQFRGTGAFQKVVGTRLCSGHSMPTLMIGIELYICQIMLEPVPMSYMCDCPSRSKEGEIRSPNVLEMGL